MTSPANPVGRLDRRPARGSCGAYGVAFGLTTAFTPIQLPAVPPGVGLLNRLEQHTGRSAFRVTERLGARLSHRRSVAVSLLTVLGTLETPYFVVDAVLSREVRPVVEVYEI
ncbi:hypothetical protein [Dactylosporangium sp. CA-233914]|uniref:hypothetical protein n=1 Tax=Dactylosporangium sp. CA-233914 TaxID=3239934 RepID=UPI003D8EEB41